MHGWNIVKNKTLRYGVTQHNDKAVSPVLSYNLYDKQHNQPVSQGSASRTQDLLDSSGKQGCTAIPTYRQDKRYGIST